MSALGPRAFEFQRRRELTQSANRVLTHRSEEASLFDHLIGAGEQRRRDVETG